MYSFIITLLKKYLDNQTIFAYTLTKKLFDSQTISQSNKIEDSKRRTHYVRKVKRNHCRPVKRRCRQHHRGSSFKEDLGADSLDLFELVMALEDEYSVEIPSDDLQNLLTVGDVMNYLKEKGVEA